MTIELTEAERAFDSFIQTRREQGRATYGQGLDHRDTRWSWERMALEEMVDACQYLVAETLRLRDLLAEVRESAGHGTTVDQLARIDAALAPRTPEGGC